MEEKDDENLPLLNKDEEGDESFKTIPEPTTTDTTTVFSSSAPPLGQTTPSNSNTPPPPIEAKKRSRISYRTLLITLAVLTIIGLSLQLEVATLSITYLIKFKPLDKGEGGNVMLLLPSNSSYHFDIDPSNYSAVRFSFVNTTEDTIEIILESNLDEKVAEIPYILMGNSTVDKSKKSDKDSVMTRHWPGTQSDPTGNVTCNNAKTGEKKHVHVVWKWSEIHTAHDGDYGFECFRNFTKYPKCNGSTNIKDILQDRNNGSIVSIRFCTNHKTEVHYEAHFYEYQYVPGGWRNRYIIGFNRGDEKDVTLPLNKENHHLYLTVNNMISSTADIGIKQIDAHTETDEEEFQTERTRTYYGVLSILVSSLITGILILVIQCLHWTNRSANCIK